jgi:hypothetical protein
MLLIDKMQKTFYCPQRAIASVWSRLKDLASQSGQTVYRIKRSLLHDYLCSGSKVPLLRWFLRKSYWIIYEPSCGVCSVLEKGQ